MKFNPVYIAGAFVVVVVPHAFSQYLLTEADLASTGAGGATKANSLDFRLAIGSNPKAPSTYLFNGLVFQTGNVGQTFTFDRATDPNFDSFAAYLTDGQASFVDYSATVGAVSAGASQHETVFFTALPPGNNGVDLGGFAIDYFTLSFDSLEFASPGSNPNGDGNWTDYSYSATFSVYGQPVPEPSSLALALFCLGVVLLVPEVRRVTNCRRQGGLAFSVSLRGSRPLVPRAYAPVVRRLNT